MICLFFLLFCSSMSGSLVGILGYQHQQQQLAVALLRWWWRRWFPLCIFRIYGNMIMWERNLTKSFYLCDLVCAAWMVCRAMTVSWLGLACLGLFAKTCKSPSGPVVAGLCENISQHRVTKPSNNLTSTTSKAKITPSSNDPVSLTSLLGRSIPDPPSATVHQWLIAVGKGIIW